MKRVLSILAAVCLTFVLSFSVSAESTVFKMEEDFEDYSETLDFLLFWAAERGNKSVTLELDTGGVLNGQNSLRTDYDLDVSKGWATTIYYADADPEHYSDALPSNCDGIKFTVKSTCPVAIRVCPSFNYVGSYHYIYASSTPREYTIRFEDFVGVEDPNYDFQQAEYFNNFSTVVFGEDQLDGFSRQGSVWYDDIYFFKGDDPTYLGSKEEAEADMPTDEPTTQPITTTVPDGSGTETTAPGDNSEASEPDTGDTTVTTGTGTTKDAGVPDSNPHEASEGSVLPWIIGGIVLVVLAGGGIGGYFLYKKKAGSGTTPPENPGA